jgi:hypothetical protein
MDAVQGACRDINMMVRSETSQSHFADAMIVRAAPVTGLFLRRTLATSRNTARVLALPQGRRSLEDRSVTCSLLLFARLDPKAS